MSIGRRIILSMSLMALMVACTAAFTLYATQEMNEVIQRLTTEDIPSIRLVDEVVTSSTDVSIAEQQFLTYGDEETLARHRVGLEKLRRLAEQLKRARNGNDPVYLDLHRKLTDYISVEREVVSYYLEGDIEMARYRSGSGVARLREEIAADCSKLLGAFRTELAQHQTEYEAMGDQLNRTSWAFAGLAVVLAGVLAFFSIRALIKPLDRLVGTTAAIRAGDLSRRADERGGDELSQLAQSLNIMVSELQTTLEEKDHAQVELTESNLLLLQREEQFKRELRFAQKVQRSIVPRGPEVPGVRIFARIQPAREVGGDFYDVFELEKRNGHVGVVVGDVMGKGVPAALLMVMAITVMRESYREADCVADLFRLANEHMQEQIYEDDLPRGVSAAGLTIDIATKELSYAKAGHEDILLRRAATGEVETLSAPGIFLGVFLEQAYEERHARLEEGDKIVLYTDGITEARNEAGGMFGIERLVSILQAEGHAPVATLGNHILGAVETYQAGTEPSDDIALVIVEIV